MISSNLPTEAEPVAVSTEPREAFENTVRQDAGSLARAAELSAHSIDPPASVPGYAITRRLGEGAYGSVWLATERNTGKQVAVKFYSHRRGLDWSLLNREVEKLAVLYTSRNIVGLIDVGWDSDPPYYIMEFLENGSLANLLDDGALSSAETVRITRSILYALVHAHGSGILHCDLKPANVLLDADFEPRLCDFGQSRLSDEQNPALGTLFYMAPEQADLRAVPDARWDVYALGALMYQMLTGEAPFRTPVNSKRIREAAKLEDKLAEYRRILRSSPKPTLRGVDRRLTEIVDRCLRTNPEKRFANAQAVLDAVEDRDRQRARRPMLILGVFFPFILLLLLSPMALRARSQAVETATESLKQRAIESDLLSANILASSIQDDIKARTQELEDIAKEPLLQFYVEENEKWLRKQHEEIQPGMTDEQVLKIRRRYWEKFRRPFLKRLEDAKDAGDKRRASSNRSADRSWFVTDAEGYQVWRYPEDLERTIDKRWNFRDYFHGKGKDFDPKKTPADLKPIEQPHLSLAFRSKSTKKFMVAISVPIRNDEGKILGVLARTMDLGDLLRDYSAGFRTERQELRARTVALVENTDGKLLDHPWMNRENLDKLEETDRELKSLTLSKPLQREMLAAQKRIRRRIEIKIDNAGKTAGVSNKSTRKRTDSESFSRDDYVDPVGQLEIPSANAYEGEWLAAFVPVGDTGWTVIVQERKSLAVEPIDDMEQGLISSGKWALVMFVGLIVSVWAFLAWRTGDGSGRSIFRNGGDRRTATENTTTPRGTTP